ncbi:Rieske (2Fe-2S) protein [Streptomyces sp. NPDC059740]|uniref:Rieske (2Fe-2S) protein n=1 Tax=Streptomyces sp. NPDC059740 TaxID=3346926 RepID=UPI003651038E
MSKPPTRRTVLWGAALAGVAGAGVTACGPDDSDGAAPTSPVELGPASDVPVGGATLYREHRLVVSQPTEGAYKCFTATCTHAGCVLDKVEKEVGSCPCHGSRFDVATGKVVHGPAEKPLTEVPVRARGGKIIAG